MKIKNNKKVVLPTRRRNGNTLQLQTERIQRHNIVEMTAK